ncbi:MAG: RidA family protein [Gammaproteobacteria bacterium]|jgi:enamine deaminase RidA (YjgF/YER057c/UK114 family)|nr:RidA family protein [Gammaproteobacteria bacterium]MBU0772689.1 RidA family protein [Gammaproteobacteria bacterium]MBU0857979.1 RidA family protein [Gammaproteobacteria bacterium]MBU1846724.1 RidA family protein [Gammaproteobacteria bacterium]
MTDINDARTVDATRHRFINPPDLYDPAANGYTHVVTARTPARLIYIAGQGGEHRDGELPADFALQVAQALANLAVALEAADAMPKHVVKLTALVVDHSHERLAVLAGALRGMWGDAPAPACTLVPVPRLALDGMLFEIDATAIVPSR